MPIGNATWGDFTCNSDTEMISDATKAVVGTTCLRTDVGALPGTLYELRALPNNILDNWQPVVYGGGAPYLGPQTMAELQAGAYADGTPELAALAKDTVVYDPDLLCSYVPNAAGTAWTAGRAGQKVSIADLATRMSLGRPVPVGVQLIDPATGRVYGQSDGAGGYDPLGPAGAADATNTAAQLATKESGGTLVPYTTYVANDVGEEFYAAAANKLIPRYTRVRCDLPGFGGTWTGLTDDSAAIAAAAAYAATFTPRRAIELPRRVGVASSIFIPMYVHVYGHQYTGRGQIVNTKVIPLAGASFSTGYVFNLNTTDGLNASETTIVGEPGSAWALNAWCSIKGVFFDNTPNDIVGSRLCVFAGPAVFEDIWGFFATQLIRQAPNVYADNTFIQRVFSHRSLDNSEYMIHLGSNTGGGGDCCYLSNMSCSPGIYSGGMPEKFINLGYSNNGRISNVINGAINIIGSSEVAISNWHNENAKLTVERSNLSIHNSSVEVYAPRTDVPFEFNTSYGSTSDSFVVTLDNVRFSFGTDVTREGIIPAEVKVSKAYVLEVRNCYRQDATSGSITRTGIRINTDADVAIPTWNNFSGWLSQSGSLVRHIARGIYDVYCSANNFYGVGTPSLVTRGGTGNTFVDGQTYYYRAQHLLDVPNMIGFNPTNAEVSIAMPGTGANTKRVVAAISHNLGVPVKGTVRVYRGTSPGNYDKYCDIPWFAAGYLQDMGNYVCGLPWLAHTGGMDTLTTFVGYSTVSTELGAVRAINFTQAKAYAATIDCDLGLGNRVQVSALTGNITHSNPTNIPRSQTDVVYEFTQDGTGGRTITWSSLHKGAWPTASGTANQKMLVMGISNGTQIIFTGSSGWYS